MTKPAGGSERAYLVAEEQDNTCYPLRGLKVLLEEMEQKGAARPRSLGKTAKLKREDLQSVQTPAWWVKCMYSLI